MEETEKIIMMMGEIKMSIRHKNGQMWYDEEGKPIQAHGGCILKHEGIWYWYGEDKGADNVLGTQRVDVIGVSCYSSKNLVSWHHEGVVLPAVTDDPDHPLAPSMVCERPKVVYNEKTKNFVMWLHLDNGERNYAGNGIAIAHKPNGPFQFIRAKHPNRQDSRDMTLFMDLDKTVWLVHTSNWNRTLNIARLNEDYTDTDGYYISVLPDQMREAPALLFHEGMYYMVTSGCTGWEPNSALYAECPYLLGQWRLIDNPCEGENYRNTFGGQSAYIFTAEGTHYLMLDHWKKDELRNSGYSILPVTVEDRRLTVRWQDYFEGI